MKLLLTKVINDARHLADGISQAQAGDITPACIPLISRFTGLTAEGLFTMSMSRNPVFDTNDALAIYNSGCRVNNSTSEVATRFHRILAARRMIYSDPRFSLSNDIVKYYRTPHQFQTIVGLLNVHPPSYVALYVYSDLGIVFI